MIAGPNGSPDFRSITFRGSRTFYTAALFLPRRVRNDVFILYAFLRTIDDLVDCRPADRKNFNRIRRLTLAGLGGQLTGDALVDGFSDLSRRKKFDPAWTRAFFDSQRIDLETGSYSDHRHLGLFIYGVAEVVGLFMSAILDLPVRVYPFARDLGHSMQIINIIRDVSEDAARGRVYLPASSLARFGLGSVPPRNDADRGKFEALIRYEIDRWQVFADRARRGFRAIPRDTRLAILASDRLYRWLAARFRKDPLLVLRRKVKPSLLRIIFTVAACAVLPALTQPKSASGKEASG